MDTDRSKWQRRLRRLIPVVMIAVFCAAIWALHRELSNFSLGKFQEFLRSLSPLRVSLAIGITVITYGTMICYDWFALRYIGRKMAAWRVAFTAFVAYAFSMNVGQTVLSGGAIRLRLYTGWGLNAGEVARIVAFNFVIGLFGQLLLSGLLFVIVGVTIPNEMPIPLQSVRWLGVVLLIAVAVFLAKVFLRRESIDVKKWHFDLPAPGVAIPAVLISALDWALAGVVLFILFPQDTGLGLWQLLALLMLAHIIAVLSMVPGGLGVFEAVIIYLLPESVPKADALSALIAFRAIFHLFPFLVAFVMFGGHQLAASHSKFDAARE